MSTSEVKSKVECKRKFHTQEVLQLKKRLTHLEEETNLMKQEMSQNIAERKALLDEVYGRLKNVHFSLHPEHQTSRYKLCKEGGRLDGLSQVLYEDRNPSVFIRGANSVAGPATDQSILPNILCIEYDK